MADVIQKSVDHTYIDFTTRVAAARKMTAAAVDAVGQGRVWSGAQARKRGLVDALGFFGDAVKAAAARAKLGGKPRLIYIEPEPGVWARVVTMLNTQISSLIGAQIDARVGGFGVPPAVSHDAERELGWVAGIAEHRKPFAAIVHCLCGGPF